jgi:hypothetical protein
LALNGRVAVVHVVLDRQALLRQAVFEDVALAAVLQDRGPHFVCRFG